MASKRTVNNVSAVETIEDKIAELQALKNVVQFVENEIENDISWAKEYEEQIAIAEKDGEKVSEQDYRRIYVKEHNSRADAMRRILSKLVD